MHTYIQKYIHAVPYYCCGSIFLDVDVDITTTTTRRHGLLPSLETIHIDGRLLTVHIQQAVALVEEVPVKGPKGKLAFRPVVGCVRTSGWTAGGLARFSLSVASRKPGFPS